MLVFITTTYCTSHFSYMTQLYLPSYLFPQLLSVALPLRSCLTRLYYNVESLNLSMKCALFFLFFVLKNKRSSLLLQHNKTYWVGHWLGTLLCLDTWDHIAHFIPGYKCHGFYHLYLIFTGAGFCLYNSNNFYGILGYCWVLWCTN